MDSDKIFSKDKLKVHMFYIIVILILALVVVITDRGYDNKDLSQWIAFGATLSGIILSVLAIILTLIGETKSDNTKDSLLNISKKLEDIVGNVEDATYKLENVSDMKDEIKEEISVGLSNMVLKVDKENMPSSLNKDISNKENESNHIEFFREYFKFIRHDNSMKLCILSVFYCGAKQIRHNNGSLGYDDLYSVVKTVLFFDDETMKIAWNVLTVFFSGLNSDDNFYYYICNIFKEIYPYEKECLDLKLEDYL
ncbi:TPA: hypothetical protein KNR49_001306 [Clostridioides difficile]|uniref:hypothetical protein n=1 Tax=Clostridioides difficile TaxID=1496 RepID=UPI00038D4491|nr:hypothetical protein [Clostridioides difficile]EGT3664881.1 hypothetical protein [Clostridioides difficile]EGT4700473.1 hypothetical protein [Clostridioides difficile]EGT5175580.1 hypothetical protein [Clostridioides difficile]EGT5565538.1 hypothetical protein [Clostridioides difficile]EII6811662.1 hypothetical protein [Clostridioides difficile]